MKEAKESEKGLTIQCQRGETEEQAIARTMLSPALQSACTLKEYINADIDLELPDLIHCLDQQNKHVKEGSLERIEEMLLSQAQTLDAIANNLFRRSRGQEYMSQLETFMKLGLKAQNQCRTTLEALLRAKNPKTLNQTNIAHNQQINNRLGNENPPNELLEKSDGLEPGTPQEAVRVDQNMETVGEQHRSTDKKRQG